jgi:chlorobactene glucosyltransferase
VVTGAPLPAGWLGKPWACHQLVQLAAYDLLLFTDADVIWKPGALAALVAHQQATDAHLLTLWPTQQTVTLAERLIVPMMAFTLLAYLPVAWAHDPRMPAAAAANGQCLLFRRAAYLACGGHAAIAHHVLDDVTLARRVKQAGLRLRMVDGAGLVVCRMYYGLQETLDGYTKNILAAHAGSLPLLLLSALLHLALFVLPWLWLLAGRRWELPAWPNWPLLLVALGLAVRGLTARTARLRLADVPLLPVSVLLVTLIALRAASARLRGRAPHWKGRRLAHAPESGHDLPR